MQKYSIPGASLAVVKDGRLVYASGYGYADKQKKIPFKPTSIFRIASISKPITSLAVMKIIESGKGGLTLDTKVFPYLGLKPHLEPGAETDSRLNSITVRQLLTHSGGLGFHRQRRPDVYAGSNSCKHGGRFSSFCKRHCQVYDGKTPGF